MYHQSSPWANQPSFHAEYIPDFPPAYHGAAFSPMPPMHAQPAAAPAWRPPPRPATAHPAEPDALAWAHRHSCPPEDLLQILAKVAESNHRLEIRADDIAVGSEIDRGSFGAICLAQHKGNAVVVKRVSEVSPCPARAGAKAQTQAKARELLQASRCRHRHGRIPPPPAQHVRVSAPCSADSSRCQRACGVRVCMPCLRCDERARRARETDRDTQRHRHRRRDAETHTVTRD
jgi:hypothetical protein